MVLLASNHDSSAAAEGEWRNKYNAGAEDLNYLRTIDPSDSVRPFLIRRGDLTLTVRFNKTWPIRTPGF
jgi:hypothetical protein